MNKNHNTVRDLKSQEYSTQACSNKVLSAINMHWHSFKYLFLRRRGKNGTAMSFSSNDYLPHKVFCTLNFTFISPIFQLSLTNSFQKHAPPALLKTTLTQCTNTCFTTSVCMTVSQYLCMHSGEIKSSLVQPNKSKSSVKGFFFF